MLVSVLSEEIWTSVTSGIKKGVTLSIFRRWIFGNQESTFCRVLIRMLREIKREYCHFIACFKFYHCVDIFGFRKRETFFFSQKKFLIHFCAIYINHCSREKRERRNYRASLSKLCLLCVSFDVIGTIGV